MRKVKGISRAIKGSTAHFQGYFWKTVNSCNFVQGREKTADLLFIADFVAEFSIYFMLI